MGAKWNRENRDRIRATSRAWKKRMGYRRSKEKTRAAGIKWMYGISVEEYDARLQAQDNICALCKKPFVGSRFEATAPCLDHDHETDKLRKFIHRKCNAGLGMFEDDAVLCRLAAEYLEKNS